MRAFVNTEVTRDQLIASLRAHREADRIIAGRYWGNGKGCAVGCSIHDFRPGSEGDHSLYPVLFGVPEPLARLQDTIFEGLPADLRPDWPLRFFEAIQEGADLSRVEPAFLLRVQERNRERVQTLDLPAYLRDKVTAAIDLALSYLRHWRDTGERHEGLRSAAWSAAESAAWSAARSAAVSAARSAESAESAAVSAAWSTARSAAVSAARSAESAAESAESAAWSAARSAESAAESAWSAAVSAAWSAARSAAVSAEYAWMADVLIAELERAPVEADHRAAKENDP
jgi:hypothetical protein